MMLLTVRNVAVATLTLSVLALGSQSLALADDGMSQGYNNTSRAQMNQNNTYEEPSFFERLFDRNDRNNQQMRERRAYGANQERRMGYHHGHPHQGHYSEGMNEDYHHGFHKLAMAWEQELDLTMEQKNQLREIKKTYMDETEPMEKEVRMLRQKTMQYMASPDLDEGEIKNMIDELADKKRDLMKRRVDFYFEVEEILTPEQVTESRAFWADHMKKAEMMHAKQEYMQDKHQMMQQRNTSYNNSRGMQGENYHEQHFYNGRSQYESSQNRY